MANSRPGRMKIMSYVKTMIHVASHKEERYGEKIVLILQTSPLYDQSCFGNGKKRLCNMNPCQRAMAIIFWVKPAHSICLLSKWHSHYMAPNKTEKAVLWVCKHHRLTIPLVLCIFHIKVG